MISGCLYFSSGISLSFCGYETCTMSKNILIYLIGIVLIFNFGNKLLLNTVFAKYSNNYLNTITFCEPGICLGVVSCVTPCDP